MKPGYVTAYDEESLASYRRGLETGVMKSATPNCVRHLIEMIDRLTSERDWINEGHQRMNKMLSELWNFMVREKLIDEKLAEEAGPANDHESRGRLNIAEVAERVMVRQKREIDELRERERPVSTVDEAIEVQREEIRRLCTEVAPCGHFGANFILDNETGQEICVVCREIRQIGLRSR
jgi:hypothetical protein